MTSPYGHPFSQTLPDLTASLERKPRRTAAHAATTGNIADLTAATVTHDGVVLTAGKRLLVWQQTDPLEDGVYAVGIVSAGTATLYRVWPMSDQTEFVDRIFPGDMIYVEAGTLHGKSLFLNTWTGDPVVGTDAPVWRKLVTPAGETLTAADIPITDTGSFFTTDNVNAALQQLGPLLGVSTIQIATGTLVAGTATIAAGITVTANTRGFPAPAAVVTGSANFGSLAHLFASNVVGGPGVGAVTIQALGNDGALDADAAGAFAVLLIN